jgi:hypothetical protein
VHHTLSGTLNILGGGKKTKSGLINIYVSLQSVLAVSGPRDGPAIKIGISKTMGATTRERGRERALPYLAHG